MSQIRRATLRVETNRIGRRRRGRVYQETDRGTQIALRDRALFLRDATTLIEADFDPVGQARRFDVIREL